MLWMSQRRLVLAVYRTSFVHYMDDILTFPTSNIHFFRLCENKQRFQCLLTDSKNTHKAFHKGYYVRTADKA